MNLLAIDTSTEACSVALAVESNNVISRFEVAPRQHTRLLPEMLASVIEEANIAKNELTHVAYGNGPGAFTGVRIAASMAQGISVGLGIPLIPVSTLQSLAQTCFDTMPTDHVLTALDARMGEIYWAGYKKLENGSLEISYPEAINRIEDISINNPEIATGVGHGWLLLDNTLASHDISIHTELLPRAESMISIIQNKKAINQSIETLMPGEQVSINYLRNNVAAKPKPR